MKSALAVAIGCVLTCAPVFAGPGASFELIAAGTTSGGGTSEGGDLGIAGTNGRPSVGAATGGPYTLTGGSGLVPPPPTDPLVPCPSDLDGSGDVGFADLLTVMSTWGPCADACPSDLDGSGDVGFADLLTVMSTWGPCS